MRVNVMQLDGGGDIAAPTVTPQSSGVGIDPTGSAPTAAGSSVSTVTPRSSGVGIDPTGSGPTAPIADILAPNSGASSAGSPDNSGSNANVSQYTNPTTIPYDQANVAAFTQDFKQKYGRTPTAADFKTWRLSSIPPMPTDAGAHQHYKYYPQTGWRLYWDIGYGPGAWGASLNGNNPTINVLDQYFMTSTGTDVYTSTSDTPAGNGGTASIQESNTIFTDITDTPQLPEAVPPPVYALDTPENLYIDADSFSPSQTTETIYIGTSTSPTTLSTTVYSTNLKFDSVDGAVKYNYRISATI